MILRGKAHKYGANVDTDAIIPARYLNTSDPVILAQHCMEDIDSEFTQRVRSGDMIVAGPNFGSGSSREHAPIAIKACGISCVIAESFARIFYRNAINVGLPVLEAPDAVAGIDPGSELEVDLSTGRITTRGGTEVYVARAYPDFLMEIVARGGLLEYTRQKLQGEGS